MVSFTLCYRDVQKTLVNQLHSLSQALVRNTTPYSHAGGRGPGQEGKWRSQALTETCSLLSKGTFTQGLLVKAWLWWCKSCFQTNQTNQWTALKSTWKWWFGKLLVWTPVLYSMSVNRVPLEWTSIDYIWLAYNAFSVAASFHRNWIKLFVSIALHLQIC